MTTGTLVANIEGNVTGNVTGNTSGTAATVTGAAQSNITSLGTLTGLTVDGTSTLTGGDSGDILLVFNTDRTWQFQQNGDDGSTSLGLKANTDSKSFVIQNSNGDIDFNFFTSHSGTPSFTLGKDAVLTFEGASDDANETTLTVTDPTADRTITLPNATGTVITTGNTSDVTTVGTLTTLTVDNVIINGSTIGHTGDTDLMTVASGVLTVAGEVDATSLDISGDADIDGTLEADAITVNGTALNTVIADEATALAIALG